MFCCQLGWYEDGIWSRFGGKVHGQCRLRYLQAVTIYNSFGTAGVFDFSEELGTVSDEM